MSRFVDSIITYRILRMLTTPFRDTKAYELGIIDDKGKELKKMRDLRSVSERDAYTILNRLVFRLKRIIEKVPFENKKFLSYAAALSLIRENIELTHEPIELESIYLKRVTEDLQEELRVVEGFINKTNTLTFRQFMDEDIPANNAGGGGIDGFTPDTMGVPKPAAMSYKKKNQLASNIISKAIRTDLDGGNK
tara:strand:+ start:1253 stop:1831 length:579 start_codon:yes stop_codon:yes gene_type:complete